MNSLIAERAVVGVQEQGGRPRWLPGLAGTDTGAVNAALQLPQRHLGLPPAPPVGAGEINGIDASLSFWLGDYARVRPTSDQLRRGVLKRRRAEASALLP